MLNCPFLKDIVNPFMLTFVSFLTLTSLVFDSFLLYVTARCSTLCYTPSCSTFLINQGTSSEMIFRNHNLGVRGIYFYWVLITRPLQWIELGKYINIIF